MTAFVAFGVVFVIACGIGASRLTLFWDDYEFILMQIKEPFGSILMGSNGHEGPLSRLALRLVSQVFGLWYPGYAMTNAALAVASAGMLMAAVRPRLGRRSWLLLVGGVVYLTSLGLVSQVLIAICLEWFVGLCLAAGSALAVSRGRHWAVWGGLLLASWLAMSGIFAVSACLVAVVYLITRWPDVVESSAGRRRVLMVVVGLVLVGVVGGVAGTVLTRLFPSYYYRAIAEQTGAVPVPSNIGEVFSTTAFLFGGWTSAPLLVVALTSMTFIMTVTIFLAAHAGLYYGGLTALLAVAAVLLWRAAGRSTWPRAVERALPFAMLLPALEWALLLSTARQGAPFPVRYQMIWLLPMMACYVMVIAAPVRLPVLRVLQVVGAVLIAGSAVVGIVRLPASMQAGADEDKPRWDMSMQQRDRMRECGVPGSPLPVPVDDISPALPAEDFCTVVLYLRENSLAGRVFGFDG
jgi:hypothetical protein